jgi:superfamily II DNA helicase RecQ
VEDGRNVLFMAPEQLISPGFNDLANDGGEFAAQLCAIAVDEAHLLNTWGRSWRKAFRQIGFVSARFSRVVLAKFIVRCSSFRILPLLGGR